MLKINRPVQNEFPKMDAVKKLSEFSGELSEFHPVFYDIETTGLSKIHNSLYLIGAVKYVDGSAVLFQWMTQSPEEEPQLLREFAGFLKDSGAVLTVQYNGNRFDQPFLEERFQKYGIDSPFKCLPSLDLYLKLKPLRGFLGLARLRQTDLESLLPLMPRRYPDGGVCIRLYRSWLKSGRKTDEEAVLGHNAEDLLRLSRVFELLALNALFKGTYTPAGAKIRENRALLLVKLPYPSPAVFQNGNREFSIRVSGDEAQLLLPLKDGRLKHFYADYKNYDYLPGEDTAIPKAISRYMDRELRVPAATSTCYTWISCGTEFLNSQEKQLQYLTGALPPLLASLNTK